MGDKQPETEKIEKILAYIADEAGSIQYTDEKEIQKFLVQFIEKFNLDLNQPFTHQFRRLLGRELLRDEQFALDTLYRIVRYLRSVDGPPQPGWLRRLR